MKHGKHQREAPVHVGVVEDPRMNGAGAPPRKLSHIFRLLLMHLK
jgi:hypothetical protein